MEDFLPRCPASGVGSRSRDSERIPMGALSPPLFAQLILNQSVDRWVSLCSTQPTNLMHCYSNEMALYTCRPSGA